MAGKILAKAGFFAVILKFWKLIAVGVVAAGAWIMRIVKGRRREEEQLPSAPGT